MVIAARRVRSGRAPPSNLGVGKLESNALLALVTSFLDPLAVKYLMRGAGRKTKGFQARIALFLHALLFCMPSRVSVPILIVFRLRPD